MRAFLNTSPGGALAPSVQYVHAVLRRALGTAARPEVRPLDAGEARRVLDAARGGRLVALYSVAVDLRQGEPLGLRWRDLDRELLTGCVQL